MKIIIFSPQSWHHIKVSKHHYALAFAEEHEVYFVNPCDTGFGMEFNLITSIDSPNLKIINYKIPIPELFKHRLPKLYKKAVEKFLKYHLHHLHKYFNIAIDFGYYQFFDSLDFLKADRKIFFPVDDNSKLGKSKRGADFLFTVSHVIQKKFMANNIACEWINHGLGKEFVQIAKENPDTKTTNQKIKVGYSGNLMIPYLDIPILETIISSHPEIEFHFFGEPTRTGVSPKMDSWHKFLTTQKNIICHGNLFISELATNLKYMDAFLFCYKPDYINYHAENSHKILEYLSTGKVIISTYLSVYENLKLYPMTEKDRNEDLPTLFSQIIKNIIQWNTNFMSNKRKLYALENTYASKINHIISVI